MTRFAGLLACCLLPASLYAVPRDACTLLSPATVQKVVGEPVTNTKPAVNIVGGLRESQCFYSMHTFANSVSLTLMEGAPNHADAAREQWRQWFHKTEHEQEEERLKNKKVKRPGDDEEDEAAAKPVEVSGIGEDAFWVHSFVGNLYVRKGDRFLRVSVGGKLTDDQRQERAKALAAAALKSLR